MTGSSELGGADLDVLAFLEFISLHDEFVRTLLAGVCVDLST
jgi:hypothetical protein